MAVAKPRNLREAAAVEAGLRQKYPQMYEEDWGKKKKKAKPKTESLPAKIKQHRNSEQRALNEALTGDDIKRLIGR